MAEWFKNEQFWKTFYPILFSRERFKKAGPEVDQIIKLTRFQGKAILDLCCGPGRHSCLLAKKRYQVTGVDRTSYLLNKARARARKHKVKVEWIKSDMRQFTRPNGFDMALSLFTSFGYFDDKAEDSRVLNNIHASLKRRGILVMDLVGKEWLAKVFQPTRSETLENNTLLVQRGEIFDEWSRIRNEWILIKGKRAERFSLHHTLYSGQELKMLLHAAGFPKVKLYGNLEGDEYGLGASRLVVVARKG
jgi:SAM-dependent methyltransferase